MASSDHTFPFTLFARVMSSQKKRRRSTVAPLHVVCDAAVTGSGTAAAARQGRSAGGDGELWDLSKPPPRGVSSSASLREAPKSAAVAVLLEVARAKALDRLRKVLHALCSARGLEAPPQLALERWRFACKLAEELGDKHPAAREPLLPCRPDGASLVRDLLRSGLDEAASSEVAAALGTASATAAGELVALSRRLASAPPAVSVTVQRSRRSLALSCNGERVIITHAAYGKLVALHRQHGLASERIPAEVPLPADPELYAAFHQRMFALLLRYKTLHGHGFQAAAGPPVFRVLAQHLGGAAFETFASPLNARHMRFCSAFSDTDAPFGSYGSFFGFDASSGVFELNPPFVPDLMDAALARCLGQLTAAESAARSLTFAVLLPGWEEQAAVTSARASVYLRLEVAISAADHGFVDGASHARQDPFRSSPWPTLVFILQTSAAAATSPLNLITLEADLRDAFAFCVPSAAALVRQKRAPKGQGAQKGTKAR